MLRIILLIVNAFYINAYINFWIKNWAFESLKFIEIWHQISKIFPKFALNRSQTPDLPTFWEKSQISTIFPTFHAHPTNFVAPKAKIRNQIYRIYLWKVIIRAVGPQVTSSRS
jgi:hypothetical protein